MNEQLMNIVPMQPVAGENGDISSLESMRDALQIMADMLRATNESMLRMEKQIRLLEKVTPGQATRLNARIRERAKELCALYGIRSGEKTVAAKLRREVKLQFGATSMRDLPRCDLDAALAMIAGWDDFKTMKRIRDKERMGR